MNWERVLRFAVWLFLIPTVIAFLQGLSLPYTWQLYAPTLEEAALLTRPVRRVIIALLAFACYLIFLRNLSGYRLAHVLALFVAASIMSFAVDLAGTRSLSASFEPLYAAAHLAVALAALTCFVVWHRIRRAQTLPSV